MYNKYKSFTLLQYVNQRLQIQLELLMMSGVTLETCSAFNERWINKFCYKVATFWLFLLNHVIYSFTFFRALWHNCYNLDQHNANIFNILRHKTPTFFGPHWPIIRECSFTRQLLRHAVVSNIQNYGKIFKVWCTDANLETIIEQSVGCSVFTVIRCGRTKVNTPQPIGYSTFCAHTCLSIS